MLGARLLSLIDKMILQRIRSQEVPDIVFGTVTSVAPLKIKISETITLEADQLLLGSLVQETWINVPTHEIFQHLHVVPQHTTEIGCAEHPHTHTVLPFNTELAHPKIKLWRGLKIGDKVRLLRCNFGQLYYVLERSEKIINDT